MRTYHQHWNVEYAFSLFLTLQELEHRAQAIAQQTVAELCVDSPEFDEEELALRTAARLMNLEALATRNDKPRVCVQMIQPCVYHVLAENVRTPFGEQADYLCGLCIWWTGKDRVRCDVLGLIHA